MSSLKHRGIFRFLHVNLLEVCIIAKGETSTVFLYYHLKLLCLLCYLDGELGNFFVHLHYMYMGKVNGIDIIVNIMMVLYSLPAYFAFNFSKNCRLVEVDVRQSASCACFSSERTIVSMNCLSVGSHWVVICFFFLENILSSLQGSNEALSVRLCMHWIYVIIKC